jgi:hypothetical protein
MDEQTSKGLWQPILDQGIESTYFFNGRLLTAFDLQKEQEANRLQHHQLGQAIGAGVADGLEVTLVNDGAGTDTPVVSVNAGLALNRVGHAIELPTKVDVMLERPSEAPPPEAGLFKVCEPPKNGKTPPGKGAYILAVRPASGFQGSAPKMRFGENGTVDGCSSNYKVEGVQFHSKELPVSELTGVSQDTRDALSELMDDIEELKARTDPLGKAQRRAKLSRLRNWLAHACLGTEEVVGFVRDPFERTNGRSPYTTYGAVDALRAARRSALNVLSDDFKLTDCDVPLALIYWTTKVHFVDMWSVRRRLTAQTPSATWPSLVSDRRLAEGEAAFLQFQNQMDHLIASGLSQTELAAIRATDYFRYLPPAGFVALGQGIFRGFNVDSFFGQQPHRDPEFIDGVVIHALLKEAMTYEPIDLAVGEMVWLYKTWQNAKAIDDGQAIQPYVIFTIGHVPHKAIARFDVARWDYANYVD